MAKVGQLAVSFLLLLSMQAMPAVSQLGWVQTRANDNSNAPIHEGGRHLHNGTPEFLSAGNTRGIRSVIAKVRPIRGRQNATHMVDLQFGVENSIARVKYLLRGTDSSHGLQGGREAEEGGLGSELDSEARGIVQYAIHGMEMEIGNPPQSKTTLVVDTGSSLVWTQCYPCTKCYQQLGGLYDPVESSLYSKVSCDSNICQYMQNTMIQPVCILGYCLYTAKYGYGSQTSVGVMGIDKWMLEGGDTEVVLFGCGYQNSGGDFAGLDGILGLDRSKLSLVSQLGGRYTQCFLLPVPGSHASATPMHFGGDISNSIPNDLELGALPRTRILGNPARPKFQFLYVLLVGISVNNERLNIPPGTFLTDNSGAGGTIMDTGSTFSVLHPDAFDALKASLLDNRPSTIDSFGGHSPCWPLNTPGILPKIVLNFWDGDMTLDVSGAYIEAAGNVCLAMTRATDGIDFNVIGNWQMINQFMIFDVQNTQISYVTYDCSRLAI